MVNPAMWAEAGGLLEEGSLTGPASDVQIEEMVIGVACLVSYLCHKLTPCFFIDVADNHIRTLLSPRTEAGPPQSLMRRP